MYYKDRKVFCFGGKYRLWFEVKVRHEPKNNIAFYIQLFNYDWLEKVFAAVACSSSAELVKSVLEV